MEQSKEVRQARPIPLLPPFHLYRRSFVCFYVLRSVFICFLFLFLFLFFFNQRRLKYWRMNLSQRRKPHSALPVKLWNIWWRDLETSWLLRKNNRRYIYVSPTRCPFPGPLLFPYCTVRVIKLSLLFFFFVVFVLFFQYLGSLCVSLLRIILQISVLFSLFSPWVKLSCSSELTW